MVEMNPYKERNRAKKVARMVEVIDGLVRRDGRDHHREAGAMVPALRDQEPLWWRQVAINAGVEPGSDETIAAVIAVYERRAARAPHVKPPAVPRPLPARSSGHRRESAAEFDEIERFQRQNVINSIRTCQHCRGTSLAEDGVCEWCDQILGGPIFTRCRCGRGYDLELFQRLPFAGFDHGDGGVTEHRRCSCGLGLERRAVEAPSDVRARLSSEVA